MVWWSDIGLGKMRRLCANIVASLNYLVILMTLHVTIITGIIFKAIVISIDMASSSENMALLS